MAQPAVALPASRAPALSIERSAVLLTVLLGIVAFLVLAPLTLMLLSSFQLARPGQPAVYGVAGWETAFTDRSILSAFGNTISLSVVREGIALVVGVMLAWLIARTDLIGKNVLEFVFWIAFFLPPLPVAMGWILLLDEHFGLINQWLTSVIGVAPFGIYSFWGIVWVHLTTTVGVKVLLLAPAFRNLDAALEESSRSCGVTIVGTLRRIVVPLMAPAIVVATVLGLIRSLDSFEIELLLGSPIRRITAIINGEPREAAIEPRRSLADFLRYDLGLTGTHVGCEHGVCGACTVLVNGRSVRSCLMFAVQVSGQQVLTVEGLAADGLHPLQQAFHEHHALQCGFCTPGMLLTTLELLHTNPTPTEAEVRKGLAGNLCMCTGYVNIVRAVLSAAGCV